MNKDNQHALNYGRLVKRNQFVTEKGTYRIDIRLYKGKVYFIKYKDGALVESSCLNDIGKDEL